MFETTRQILRAEPPVVKRREQLRDELAIVIAPFEGELDSSARYLMQQVGWHAQLAEPPAHLANGTRMHAQI